MEISVQRPDDQLLRGAYQDPPSTLYQTLNAPYLGPYTPFFGYKEGPGPVLSKEFKLSVV